MLILLKEFPQDYYEYSGLMVTQSSLGHTFYLIWPCSNWRRQKVGVRKIHTHTQRIVRACVRAASEWVVVGILYSTTHRLALPIFVAPRQSGSPYIFPTLFEKIDLLFRTFLLWLSFYLSFFLTSFLSCKLKCSEHGSAFHHLGTANPFPVMTTGISLCSNSAI